MDFFSVYKELRNRMRKFQPRSIVQMAMNALWQPVNRTVEDLARHPWQVLLLVKWALQDSMASDQTGREISPAEFDDLRQRLYDFPNRISLFPEEGSRSLFLRRMWHQQGAFQRRLSKAFLREPALLEELAMEHPLRVLFREKAGLDVLQFMDFAFAAYVAVLDGKRTFSIDWFEPLCTGYGNQCADAFIHSVSRSYPELVAFCRSLPDANKRRASEFYEFTPLKRFPFLRTESILEYWHPMVFFRGMEGFVHSLLSEAGQDYIDRFSKVFENHVVREIRRTGLDFFDEAQLQRLIGKEQRVPDALISFPDVNVFIESKAGLFDESVMVTGHAEILAHKTKALQKAIAQGWSASVGLRRAQKAPASARRASKDYLLVVTNKELNASQGTILREMYPAGTLDYPSPAEERYLPLQHVYVVSVDDFERLMAAARTPGFDIPEFLERCVEADSNLSTSKFLFEMHLDVLRVPHGCSSVLSEALNRAQERLVNALQTPIAPVT